ncbi:MAG TPA: hypothetical protein VNC22_14280 [Sporichthya sp.]|nr:hypothetical protein [Sporichthya sp.]
MATVSVQDVSRAGTTPTYNAASGGGDKFSPGAHTFVHVLNTGGSATAPTFVTPGQVQELAVADATGGTTPATTGSKMYGPFPPEIFAGSDGLCAVTWSVTSGVTFAVMRVQ